MCHASKRLIISSLPAVVFIFSQSLVLPPTSVKLIFFATMPSNCRSSSCANSAKPSPTAIYQRYNPFFRTWEILTSHCLQSGFLPVRAIVQFHIRVCTTALSLNYFEPSPLFVQSCNALCEIASCTFVESVSTSTMISCSLACQ